MRGCAPRTRGRGDPCTRYPPEKERRGTSSLLELFRFRIVDVSVSSTNPLRVLAPQLPNRDEVPHLYFFITGCRGHPCRGCGARSPAFNRTTCRCPNGRSLWCAYR